MTKSKKLFARALYAVMALALVAGLTAVPVSAADLTTVSATPGDFTQGVTTTYAIAFTTATTDTVKHVDMVFADAFDVSGATLGTVENIGAGTLSNPSGNTLRYTVTTAASISASVAITINLSSIVNPATADDYTVSIATKDVFDGTIDSGSDTVTITPVPVSFAVTAPSSGDATAGTAFNVIVTAKDGAGGTGATVTGFVGIYRIHFTTTATGSPTIPAFEDLTFASGANTTTSGNFILTNDDETPTITATAKIFDPDVTGTSAAITVNPATVDYLAITGGTTPVTAGVAFGTDVTVKAYDVYGNLATGDTESIAWTCDDGTATAGDGLPSAHVLAAGTYTFDKADFVLQEVRVVNSTVVDTTITATGAGSGGAATVTVTVNPAAANTLSSAADPASIAADGSDSSTITITAQDEFSNTDTNYSAAVTFETSFGTLSDESANFVSGVATANLTSTEVGGGTATVAASSGTMTTTQDVTLTAAPTEVWVDDTGNDSNPGTEALPFLTIATGITAAGVNGTVNVLPGNYDLSTSQILIATDGVTLQSTGTADVTIIDASASTAGNAVIEITTAANDVIVDGFTITPVTRKAISIRGSDTIVRNNIITVTGSSEIIALATEASATNTTISGNILTPINLATIYLGPSSGNTVLNNTSGTIDIEYTASDNDIIGNNLCDITSRGIKLVGAGAHNDTLIQGNTISRNTANGIHVLAEVTTVSNLVITGNTITDNGVAGIKIEDVTTWGVGNTINNNNISGNVGFGIQNLDAAVIDAENNWWGDASGPYVDTNTGGTGDAVTTAVVDYRPWLTSAYGVEEVTTVSLSTGNNFVSLPKKVESPTFGDLLSAWTTWTALSYDPVAGWTSLVSSDSINDDILAGYWVSVTTPGTISVVYESEGATVPPSKSLTGDAWNAIGFSSTTALDADTALMSIEGSWSTLIAWDAEGQAYEDSIIVGQTGNMSPGKGYWVWMTTGDVLSAISA